MRAVLASLVLAAAACGSDGQPQYVSACTEQAPINVSDVGEVVALARFGDGYVIGGLMFDTMRVATIDATGFVTPASNIGALPAIPTSVPFRAAFRVDGTQWTAIFPAESSLIGYSVDIVTGDDMTLEYEPHFTNSEPFVLWMPTAFWMGPSAQEVNIGMQRVEITGDTETAAPHVWVSPVRTVELMPGAGSGPPVAVVDGDHQLALTARGLYSYTSGAPIAQVTAMPTDIASLGPGVAGLDELLVTAVTQAGAPELVHVFRDGTTVVQAPAPGTPTPVGFVALDQGAYAWLGPDASLNFRWFDGGEAGPAATITQVTPASAPGPDVVRSGNDYAFAFTDGTTWYLARQTCE